MKRTTTVVRRDLMGTGAIAKEAPTVEYCI